MERWLSSPDPDIRWIMRENLAKSRLVREVIPGFAARFDIADLVMCLVPRHVLIVSATK